MCGGTILDSWTVLSAAHCFFEDKNFAGEEGKGREYVKGLQPYIKVGSINNVAEEAEAQVPIKLDKIGVYDIHTFLPISKDFRSGKGDLE